MPQINSGKSPPWVAGEIVTAAGLNGMIDAATLDPSVITSKTDLATLTGDEYALIVDTTGALKKTQLKNSLMAGSPIETNYIEGYQNVPAGAYGTLQIQAQQGFQIFNADSASANSGMLIQSTGGNLTLNATNSTHGHGDGLITLSSGSSGFIFTSSGTGTASFSQRTLFNTAGAIKLPVGTTLQRPAAPVTGDIRFNTTTSNLEFYNGSAWQSSDPVEAVSLTANGYIKLANGLILQWGTNLVAIANYSVSTITFPIAFPNACFNVQLTARAVTPAGAGAATLENGIKLNGVPTTTNFSVYINWAGSGAGAGIYPVWFAIGN